MLTRLVKRDVPILADTTKEELNAAVRFDLFLVRLTFLYEILRVSVEDVHLRWRDVDCDACQDSSRMSVHGVAGVTHHGRKTRGT